MRTRVSFAGRFDIPFLLALFPLLCAASLSSAGAACPPGVSYPITSGSPADGPPVVLTGLGAHPQASFFLLGSGDENNSGLLTASDWLRPMGDVDGDGLPDWIVAAPGQGPGGWGDDRTNGCPAFANPPNPPIVILIHHDKEDLDFFPAGGDGKFDVFEDRNHNGLLDPGEDVDGDGHLTPRGGCEGLTREDQDCDGHLDALNEDDNLNGRLDLGEDRDGDGRLDLGTEDRNANFNLDDRPDPSVHNDVTPDEDFRFGRFYPYGSAHPSRGSITVITIAWNGTAYTLTALNTPTTLLGPDEDLDHDGAFDVFEDRNHNGILDVGEDRDGDGRMTPPGGCEGATREDKDCDGRLDFINEDDNHNGVLDPGEDRDGDGRLDDGTEDRNHNFTLDDRPFPSLDDSYSDPVTHSLLPPYYPYETLTPRPYRLLAPTPIDALLPSIEGTRLDPQGTLRLNVGASGVALNDDVGGTRAVFDGAVLSFAESDVVHCLEPIGPPCWVPLPRFATNGFQTLRVPAAANLSLDVFTSIVPRTPDPNNVGPLRVFALSAGSDSFLASNWPTPPLPNVIDDDFDSNLYAAYPGEVIYPPFGATYSPLDTCPHQRSAVNLDGNHDGIGDRCDPGWLPNGQTAPNRWIAVDGGSLPGPRAGGASVFDAGRGVIVLFGGAADSDTWEFDGAWHQRPTNTPPEPRHGHRMIYDAVRGRVVLFGGERFSDNAPLGDQWEFNGTTGAWTRVVLAVNPGPRSGFGMAYDATRQAIVLYGGRRGGTLLGDTWVFQGGAWRLVAVPRSPGARADAAMTWDGFRRLTVLVGGDGSGDKVRNDAWEFDGATWEPVDAVGELPPTAEAVASFDAARRQVLLFGGENQTRGSIVSGVSLYFEHVAATRSFDGRRFTPLPSRDTTAPRSVPASAFDAARDRLFVQGGAQENNVTLSDTALLEQPSDTDGDGVADAGDNCPRVANPAQEDSDGDGSGDLCDDCPLLSNPDQRDRDGDGLGDACDPDRDGDGIANATDVCPDAFVPGRPDAAILGGGGADTDGDGFADDCDRCPADPLNDVDTDGVCGGADNCPNAANAMQIDTNGDGAGDACQPTVRIVSIAPQTTPPGTLEAVVVLGDPDGDRPSGRITIEPLARIAEVATAMIDPCANAFLPDGNAGQGLVYAVVPGSTPLLLDVDSIVGCSDGLIDYVMTYGTCAEALPGSGETSLPVDRPTPFPICVRGAAGAHAYVVHRVDSGAVSIGGALPALLSADYQKGKLPHQITLQGLPAPGPYVLRITAGDGTTPEVSAERLFDWNGERTLVFTLGGKKSLARPMIRIPHAY